MSAKIIYYDQVSMDLLGIMGVSEGTKKEKVSFMDIWLEIKNQYKVRWHVF